MNVCLFSNYGHNEVSKDILRQINIQRVILCLSSPPSFLCSQIISPFLNSMVSGKRVVILANCETLIILLFLFQCGISFEFSITISMKLDVFNESRKYLNVLFYFFPPIIHQRERKKIKNSTYMYYSLSLLSLMNNRLFRITQRLLYLNY